MNAVAILIANSSYDNEADLPCCLHDVEAIADLIEGSGKFEAISKITDHTSIDLKRELRQILEPSKNYKEIFFWPWAFKWR